MIKFLVMLPMCWGVGETIDTADKKARKEGGLGRKKLSRIVWSYDTETTETVYIDGMGSLVWQGERPKEIERVKVGK